MTELCNPKEYMQTVGALIEQLQALAPDTYVLLSTDEEGNVISPWCGPIETGTFRPYDAREGEFQSEALVAALGALADEEDDEPIDEHDLVFEAICLYPNH